VNFLTFFGLIYILVTPSLTASEVVYKSDINEKNVEVLKTFEDGYMEYLVGDYNYSIVCASIERMAAYQSVFGDSVIKHTYSEEINKLLGENELSSVIYICDIKSYMVVESHREDFKFLIRNEKLKQILE